MTEQNQQTTQEQTASSTPPPQEHKPESQGGFQSSNEQAEASSPKAADSRNKESDDSENETTGPRSAPQTTTSPGEAGSGEERAPLFANEEAQRFRQRWEALQAGFVDQPRQTVEQADDLVSELMQQLTAGFSDKRSNLEHQWEEGDQVSTEELRVALTRYRSFFNRLLSA